MGRVVPVNPATEVNSANLNENAWLDDHQPSVYRMARFTASCCETEGDTCGEGRDERVLDQSHVPPLAFALRC